MILLHFEPDTSDVGYQANDVIARLFGEDWQGRGSTIEFRARDGYVSLIDVSHFSEESAYLVFAREDGAPFTVDNVDQNQMGVPLGPYYLVWDNISSPALVQEGPRYWPYQVREMRLVTVSDEALVPTGLDPRFHEGAELVRTHCLSCHAVNGFGGREVRRQPRGDRQALRGGGLPVIGPYPSVGADRRNHAGAPWSPVRRGASAHCGCSFRLSQGGSGPTIEAD